MGQGDFKIANFFMCVNFCHWRLCHFYHWCVCHFYHWHVCVTFYHCSELVDGWGRTDCSGWVCTHPLPSLRRGEKERNQYIDLKRECGTGGGGEEREREINILKERENVEQVVGGGGVERRERENMFIT